MRSPQRPPRSQLSQRCARIGRPHVLPLSPHCELLLTATDI